MKPLTDINFWEESWKKDLRPRPLLLYRDFDFKTVRLLRALRGTKGARALEVSAGGSPNLS